MKNLLTALLLFATVTAAQADPNARLDRIEFDRNAVVAGQTIEARVVLEAPAQDENTWVELRGSDSVQAPMAVRVPQGATEVTFLVSTNPVDGNENAHLLAGVNGHYMESGQLVLQGEVRAAQR